MKRGVAIGLAGLAVALGGCGGGESAHNKKANREVQTCFEQADELAETKGADAGGKHLEECTHNFANELQIEE